MLRRVYTFLASTLFISVLAQAEITGLYTYPAGSSGEIQYNDNGVFGSTPTIRVDVGTGQLYVTSVTCSAGCGAGGGVSGGGYAIEPATVNARFDIGAEFGRIKISTQQINVNNGPYIFVSSVTSGQQFGIAVSSKNVNEFIGPSAIYFTPGNNPAVDLYAGDGDAPVKVSSTNAQLQSGRQLRFGDSDNSNYVGFVSPSSLSGNTVWTLPGSDSSGCLSSNGSGTLSITACGPGTPAGSNTNVQFNDGGSFGGSNSFVFDNANGFVGIGTNTPQAPLHIKRSSNEMARIERESLGAVYSLINFYQDVFGSSSLAGSLGWRYFSGAGINSGVVFLDSSGNIVHNFASDGTSALGNVGSVYNLNAGVRGLIGFSSGSVTGSGTAPNNSIVLVNATTDIVIDLPNIGGVGFGNGVGYYYRFTKINSSTNTITFTASGASDSLDSMTLLNQYDWVDYYGQSLNSSSSSGYWRKIAYSAASGVTDKIAMYYNGQGAALVAGSTDTFSLPYAFTVSTWTVTGDQSGSVSVHISSSSPSDFIAGRLYNVSGSGSPSLSSQVWNSGNVSAWTQTVFPAHTVISFVLDTAATVQKASVVVGITKP